MSHAYRSAYEHIVTERRIDVERARERLAPTLPDLHATFSARVARVLAGSVGLAGALVMVLFAAEKRDASATYALLGATVAASIAYVFARAGLAVRSMFWQPVKPLPPLSGELTTDLARLDASNPFAAIARRLEGLEFWSAALPLTAMSLLAPLTLHWLFLQVASTESASSFANWIRISLIVVGHAHLALAALSIAFARRMSKHDDDVLVAMPIHREWGKAWAITIGVAAVPGIALVGIPPALVAITGIAFIPFMFMFMHRQLIRERAAIDLARTATSAS